MRWRKSKLKKGRVKVAGSNKPHPSYQNLEVRRLLAVVWSPGPELEAGRSEAIAALGTDASIQLIGGQDTSVSYLQPGDLNWSSGPALDKQRTGLGGGSVTDGRIFVFGGINAGQAIEESYLYDPSDADSQDGASMSTPRANAAFATDPQTGFIYAIGGVDADGVLLSSVEVYDPLTDVWTAVASMPGARADQTAAADGQGHLYVFGGRRAGYGSSDATSEVLRYDIANNTWQSVASMPVALRDQISVSGPNNGLIYLAGGRTASNAVVGSVLAYDFTANSWSIETSLTTPVADAAAILDGDGRIWVIGGRLTSGQESVTVQVSQDLDAEDLVPTITTTPELTATASLQYSYQALATGNHQPEFALLQSPEGMTISASGLVQWTPTELQVGDQLVTIRAANRAGFDDQSFTIRVTSALPRITTVPPTIGGTLQAYSYDVDASGNPSPGFSLSSSPLGMTIHAFTGVISWIPGANQFGSHNVVVTATNLNGSDQQSFTIVVADKIAPSAPAGLAALDIQRNQVTLSWQASNDNAGVAKYQVYEQYKYGWRNSKTGYRLIQDNIAGTTTTVSGLTAGATYKYIVRAVDGSGNQSGNSNLVTFTTLKLPTISGPTTVSGTATHAMTAWRYYGAGVPTPTLSLVSGPEGLTFDPTNGYANWTPTDAQVGSHLLVIRSSNSEGSVTMTTTITVNANLPVITYSFTYMGKPYSLPFAVEGDLFELQLDETYTNSTVSWSLVSGPSNMVVDTNTGLVNWVPGPEHVGTATMTFRATNYAGFKDLNLSFTVYPLGTDKDPPSAVTGVTVSVIDYNRAQISWASTFDNVGVESYEITAYYTFQSRGTHTVKYTFTAPGNVNTLEMTGLPTRQLRAYVRAIDVAGNFGPVGDVVTFTPASNPNFPSISLVNPLPVEAVAGQSHQIELADSNATLRTYSLLTGPSGATIDPVSGLISWTSTYNDVGRASFTVRATNQYGYRDFSFAFNVYFTGPVLSLSYTRINNSSNMANVSWAPPVDASHVAGYLVYQYWSINGHTYSHVYRVDSASTTTLDVFVVGGPVVHKVQVAAFDLSGNLSVLTPKVSLV